MIYFIIIELNSFESTCNKADIQKRWASQPIINQTLTKRNKNEVQVPLSIQNKMKKFSSRLKTLNQKPIKKFGINMKKWQTCTLAILFKY